MKITILIDEKTKEGRMIVKRIKEYDASQSVPYGFDLDVQEAVHGLLYDRGLMKDDEEFGVCIDFSRSKKKVKK